jgi:hypothetical protein
MTTLRYLVEHLRRAGMPAAGTRLTIICTATIPSVDAGATDVGDAHRKVSVRAARHPTFYGAVPLCCARWNQRAPAARVSSFPEHEYHAAMLLPAS